MFDFEAITGGKQMLNDVLSKTLFKIKRKIFNRMNKFPLEVLDTKSERNPNKTFYVIRRISDSGFFSNVFFVMGHICYAVKKGYVPIVDMQNYSTLYNEKEKIRNTMNAWEYYFKQTENYTLEEVYNSKNVILSDNLYLRDYVPLYVGGHNETLIENKDICRLNSILEKYVQIHEELVYEFEEEWNEKFKNNVVLGVHIRGTDMKSFPNHPSPPTIKEVIEAIRTFSRNNHFDSILLCTDEEDILKSIVEEFGDMVITMESYRAAADSSVGIHFSNNARKNHKYLLGKEVLRDAYLLSKCNFFIYGNSNVAMFSLVLNGEQYQETVYLNGIRGK